MVTTNAFPALLRVVLLLSLTRSCAFALEQVAASPFDLPENETIVAFADQVCRWPYAFRDLVSFGLE